MPKHRTYYSFFVKKGTGGSLRNFLREFLFGQKTDVKFSTLPPNCDIVILHMGMEDYASLDPAGPDLDTFFKSAEFLSNWEYVCPMKKGPKEPEIKPDPDPIREHEKSMNSITDSDVYDLETLLTQVFPHKASGNVKMLNNMRKENEPPHRKFKSLLASAYDWMAYGN